MATNLVDMAALWTLLKKNHPNLPNVATDPYSELIAEAASEAVRSAAGRPLWGADPLEGEEVEAPARARFIALWVASRAWDDRARTLQRRTSGPISETYFEQTVQGLALTVEEQAWLESQRPVDGGPAWVLRHYRAAGRRRGRYGDETPDGYSFAAGDWNFAHGMDMSGGPQDADSW